MTRNQAKSAPERPSAMRLALTLDCCALTHEMFVGEPWQLDVTDLMRRIASLYDDHCCTRTA